MNRKFKSFLAMALLVFAANFAVQFTYSANALANLADGDDGGGGGGGSCSINVVCDDASCDQAYDVFGCNDGCDCHYQPPACPPWYPSWFCW